MREEFRPDEIFHA